MSSLQGARVNNINNKKQPENNINPDILEQEHVMESKTKTQNDDIDEKETPKVNLEVVIQDMPDPDKNCYKKRIFLTVDFEETSLPNTRKTRSTLQNWSRCHLWDAKIYINCF